MTWWDNPDRVDPPDDGDPPEILCDCCRDSIYDFFYDFDGVRVCSKCIDKWLAEVPFDLKQYFTDGIDDYCLDAEIERWKEPC